MYRRAKGCAINSQRTARALGHSLTPSWGLDGGGQSHAPMLSAWAQAQKCSWFSKELPGTPSPSQPAPPACTGAAATGQKKQINPPPAKAEPCPVAGLSESGTGRAGITRGAPAHAHRAGAGWV